MSKTVILYGTESGNAEMVADDFLAELGPDREVESVDMADFDVLDFDAANSYLIICSTHGDGELPSSARPLGLALDTQQPDLTGVRYWVFGLGDSSYETYSHGSEIIDEKLTALGAARVGLYGRHDASDGSLPNDDALEWMRAVLEPA